MLALVGMTSGAFLVAVVARSLTLGGLPDLGDPFDLAEFLSRRVADGDNAFIHYREAVAKMRAGRRPLPDQMNSGIGWDGLSEAERAQFEAHREALDLWRRGTERPDAAFIPLADRTSSDILDPAVDVRWLVMLACLEGSRLEGEGAFASAWGWYRAAFRSSRHLARNASAIERFWSVRSYLATSPRMKAWASQPKVDATMLRKALDDVIEIDRMTPRASDTLKVSYLMLLNDAKASTNLRDQIATAILVESSQTWRPARSALFPFEWTLRREPERSRRVFQRISANWFAHCDRPRGDRPQLIGANELLFRDDRTTSTGLESWYDSTLVLKLSWPEWRKAFSAIDRERADFAGLVVHLAGELYRRERGRHPESPEQLVGPYLKALPDGYPPTTSETGARPK